jgi:hypothetical protein
MHALLMMAFLQGIFTAPPQDFASLLKPVPVLEQLQVGTDEASLLAVLTPGEPAARATPAQLEQALKDLGGNATERRRGQQLLRAAGEDAMPVLQKTVSNDDPEVRIAAQQLLAELRQQRRQAVQNDTGYLKQLMAIRALQGLKSSQAVPALRRLAAGGNPTLADAATNAILVIQGKEPRCPKGRDTLQAVMTRLPASAGFVAVCDLERGRQARTVEDWLKEIRKMAEKDPSMLPMTAQLGSMTKEIEKGLIQGVGKLGNLRLDSITLLISNDLGVDHQSGYAACIVKGLHDPAMVAAAIKQSSPRLQEQTYRKQTVLSEHGVSFCSPDANTFVAVFSGSEDDRGMRAVLDGLLAEPKAEAAKTLQPAFEQVMSGKARLALAGSFGEAQKQSFVPQINRELQRLRQNQGNVPSQATFLSWLELLAEQFAIKSYVAYVADEALLVLDGACADAATAVGVAAKVNKLDQQLREMLGKAMAQMQARGGNGATAGVYEKLDLKKPIFEAKAADGHVVVTVNALQGSPMSLLPLMIMGQMGGHF